MTNDTLTLPDKVEDVQHILNTGAEFAKWVQAKRTTELLDHYRELTTPDMAEQVRQQMTSYYEGEQIIENKVSKAITDWFGEHGQPTRPNLGGDEGDQIIGKHYQRTAPGVAMDKVGFANIGDFAQVVFRKGPQTGDDPRYDEAVKVMNAYSGALDPSAGGFLIPEEFMAEIRRLVLEASIVRPRASIINMTSMYQLIPYVDETDRSGGTVFGGMSFSRTPESGTISPTEAKFGRVRLEASKITGLSRVPNELWADAPALTSFLMAAVPSGLAWQEDIDFLTGDGAGKPLGAGNANNPALITVAKESGQTASTIVTENVLNMYARMLPQSLSNAVWVASIDTFPQLMQLSIAVGTGGAPIMLVDVTGAPTLRLLGRPLILTEKTPALGSAGQLNFIDFGFYLLGDRQTASLASSEHSRFATDETELRVISRNDGRPWIQSALTPYNGGSTLSPFVRLAA